jgi:DNA-binding GntR family transcriptional regulator
VTTVRRALALLADAGLITVTPGWGVFRAEP